MNTAKVLGAYRDGLTEAGFEPDVVSHLVCLFAEQLHRSGPVTVDVEVEENPTDSNLVAHAIRELDLIGETSYEPPSMRKCVLDLVRTLAEQGHSGSSAAWAIGAVEKLLRFEPLSAITDNPEDWIDVADGLWQCRRNPALFSEDGGKTYHHVDDKAHVQRSAPHTVVKQGFVEDYVEHAARQARD